MATIFGYSLVGSDAVRRETEAWLFHHTAMTSQDLNLTMRGAGDYTPDDKLKRSWLHGLAVKVMGCRSAIVDDEAA